MIALTVSFEELLDLIRGNSKKWPKILETLRWDGDHMVLEIPREDIGIGATALDLNFRFSGETFTLSVNAGPIKQIASLIFKSEELFDILEQNIRKFPRILNTMAYDHIKKIFVLTMDPTDNKDVPVDKRAFQRKFRLLSKLVPLPGKKMRVRIAAE